jgi:hypothetical protein
MTIGKDFGVIYGIRRGRSNMKNLQILKTGALTINVCTNAKTKKEIERLTNQASLCGTTGGWMLDEKESKRLGQAKVQCSNDKTRTHYILYV